jgi:hypothetical protein
MAQVGTYMMDLELNSWLEPKTKNSMVSCWKMFQMTVLCQDNYCEPGVERRALCLQAGPVHGGAAPLNPHRAQEPRHPTRQDAAYQIYLFFLNRAYIQ